MRGLCVITIIDYKMINLGSIVNMLKKVGVKNICVTDKVEDIRKATKIIMPGVGSFDKAINTLKELRITEVLYQKAMIEKVPFLGICLGMQIMTESSEEGCESGLGYVRATSHKFDAKLHGIKVPHMGWNKVKPIKNSYIFDKDLNLDRFYFVHSYYVKCRNKDDILFHTTHGDDFVSGFEVDNLIGLQFHPEKSHKNGIELFKKFVGQ